MKLFVTQSDLIEDRHKEVIFIYFVGAVWVLMGLLAVQNLYLSLSLEGALAQKYAGYNPINVVTLIFLGLIWLGHRWYPRSMRHVFLLMLAVGVIFFFELRDLDRIFVAMALPIIMAAFLVQPVYSFVYYAFIVSTYTLRLYLGGFWITSEEFSFVGLVSLLVVAVVSWLIAQSLDRALAETRALNRELDQRVQVRTRELAEALARESATAVRNTTILESIADGVLFFDTDRRVVIANPAANRLAKQDLQSSTLDQLLKTVENEAREAIDSWIRGEKPADQSNVKFQWDDTTVSATIAPVLMPRDDGTYRDAGNVMVLRDFTKEAALEQAKNLFLGMVSHELRTPMSAIKGYVKLLLDREKERISEAGYDYLQTIDGSIRQLLTLANELIDLSRMEMGEIDLYYDCVDLTAVIKQAVKMVQQEFAARDLSLELNIEEDLPELYLDRGRILQVLLNLLSNAYKYTAQGGATLDVSQSSEWVNISVTDTGVGIKPSDQAKIFSRFFRAGDQTVQQAGGTGLGLSISKGLIELHGGELTFTSQYQVGTTFQIRLPKNNTTFREEVVPETVDESKDTLSQDQHLTPSEHSEPKEKADAHSLS